MEVARSKATTRPSYPESQNMGNLRKKFNTHGYQNLNIDSY